MTLLFIWQADWLVAHVFAAGYSGEALEATVFLSQIMFVYMLLISLAAVAQGILNSMRVFWVSAATPLLLNISIIGLALALKDQWENPALPFALGVVLGGILQLGFQLPHLFKRGFSLIGKLWDPQVIQVFKLIVPTIFGVGVYQINILISNLIATGLGEGALSSLTFSNRLLELVLGVLVVSITTVILPNISGHFIKGELDQVTKQIGRTLKVVALVTLPVTVIAIALREEIVELLFFRGQFDQTSLKMTAGALFFHIMGLSFIAFNRVLLTAYQGARRIQITVWVAAAAMLANLIGAFWLSQTMGHLGIALASSLSQGLQWVLLALLLSRLGLTRMWDGAFWLSIAKSGLAALSLYWPLIWLKGALAGWPLILSLPVMGFAGISGFIAVAWLLRSAEIDEARSLIRSRRQR